MTVLFVAVWASVTIVALVAKNWSVYDEGKNSTNIKVALWPLIPIFYIITGLYALCELGAVRLSKKRADPS